MSDFKGALCSSGEEIQTQDFDTYNINEVRIQTQKYLSFYNWVNKLLSEKKKDPQSTCQKPERCK